MTKAELKIITEQASGMASSIMIWASQPDVWPGFAAWAEQACPDETWDDGDREAAAVFGLFLGKIALGLAS